MSKISMEIKDLAGLSKPLKKFIEVVSAGIGTFSKSYFIKKNANAIAYEIKTVSKAIKDNKNGLKIKFQEGKVSLTSLDENSLKAELSLEERTQQRIEHKGQKRQRNIESVTQKAAEILATEKVVSDKPVDEDWTSRFFNYVEDISSEEMQWLWGKIIAGEVKNPKSYSLRTLDVLRNLSTEEAEVFIKFGTLAIQSGGTAFLLNFEGEKILEEEYQLYFKERLLLEELGILAANSLVFKIDKTDSTPSKTAFKINRLIVVYNKAKAKPKQELQVLVFTKIGQELLQLVSNSPKKDYLQLLATKLNRQNGTVKYASITEELSNGRIKHTPLIDVPCNEFDKAMAKFRV